MLADDSQEIRERVKELLQEDFDIVGSVQNGQQAIQAASVLNADLLVLDISMPGLNGIQVASRLCESGCRTKVVFLTIHEDRDYVEAAFSAGASGYVCKSRVATDLIPALQSVLRGKSFISQFGQGIDKTRSEVSTTPRATMNYRSRSAASS
ncbi:MAG TPA: response regulator transcription factor [Terriglobales bacterium]|nr:response regulator transcription factor [Terriglobales bacterium]